MLTLYLIRHGQKQKTLPDPELTDRGHEQAKKTGKFLVTKNISKVVASPMVRTQQTAGHIARALGLNINTDARLKERMDYQDYKESTMDAFIQEWIKASSDRQYIPRWGDSSFKTGKRVQQVIEELDHSEDQHIALVTHGGAIADFLRNNFDITELKKQMSDIVLDDDFDIKECSITTVVKNGDKYSLVECHYITHLN